MQGLEAEDSFLPMPRSARVGVAGGSTMEPPAPLPPPSVRVPAFFGSIFRYSPISVMASITSSLPWSLRFLFPRRLLGLALVRLGRRLAWPAPFPGWPAGSSGRGTSLNTYGSRPGPQRAGRHRRQSRNRLARIRGIGVAADPPGGKGPAVSGFLSRIALSWSEKVLTVAHFAPCHGIAKRPYKCTHLTLSRQQDLSENPENSAS